MPPCGRYCPKRSQVCHDREVCPEWGIYEDELAAWHKMLRDARRAESDYNGTRIVAAEERKKWRNT